jgi:hypothetical protein
VGDHVSGGREGDEMNNYMVEIRTENSKVRFVFSNNLDAETFLRTAFNAHIDANEHDTVEFMICEMP